jgi:LuxR family maltose regulon positive regulatory protein
MAHSGPPEVPSFAIRRTRLERRLDEHSDRQVVLVRGPAGAGKTVLVAQWVRTHDDPCAWLTIDTTDNHGRVLVCHIAEAVGQLVLDVPVAVRSTEEGGIDHTLLGDGLAAVAQRAGAVVTLVLDDVHRLHDRIARHVVERLVERPPGGVRLVLISRSKPGLGLERARLRGDLVEIPPAALRFERAEIDALASTWSSPRLDAAELERATMGWAAGLRLVELEGRADDARSPDVPAAGVADDYIREELIEASPVHVRGFLEVSCWLPWFTEPLCAAVAGGRSALTPATPPEVEELPIMPVGSRPGAFRHPPIVSRTLQQEYVRRDPSAAMTACRRAAQACRTAGELVTAVELFVQSGCTEEAVDVCAELAAGGEDPLRGVDELLHRLPEIAPVGTRLLAWRIRAAVAAGRVDEACRLLDQSDRATASAESRGAIDGPDLVIARGLVAEHLGDVSTLLACAARLLAPVDGAATRQTLALRAHGWRIRALVWSGDPDAARVAARALDKAPVGSAPDAAGHIALARAWVAWLDGDISGIAENVAAAQRALSENGAGSAEVALLAGSAQRERDQLAKAVPRIEQARGLAGASSHHVLAALAASELALCQHASGSTMEALEVVMSTRAAHPDLPPAVDVHLRSTEVHVRLDRGDTAGAEAVVHGAPPGADTQLMAARVALQQSPAQARRLLETCDARTPRQVVDKLLLRAQLPDAAADDRSASIVEAVSTGGPLGLVRTFLDEGPTVTRTLPKLALEHTDRTLGRLAALACQELALAPARALAGPVEQLTPREFAVLRMLPLRMSNREMADQLYISVNTIKTHIRAIYRKLDAPHRSAAVRRATALQLV